MLIEAIRILALYGYKRSEALDLPHWEFWQLIRSHSKHEAREKLFLIRAVNAGMVGGTESTQELVNSLSIQAGLIEPSPPVVEKLTNSVPWTVRLMTALGNGKVIK